ncbi:ATP-binding protein [Streptomyces sp. NBC_00557]|uniref:ATP-binding protein n=1 Tax=Streptomyces sp. NBC_00557 TaxID=2975776 RepID=UPI002E81B6F6|nr:ATP-binding protein [Streptomyces sp. NBC_00557]WUC35100.1 ATP-binding protein [Streptomyces sp. NBC_00557]
MKQSAAKTLGVAALGAAFAAVGAGAANAAPAVPDAGQATQALGGVARTLPAENVSRAVPGATEALTQGQGAVGSGLAAAQPAVKNVLAKGPTAPVARLLGGLPLHHTGLPTHGVPLNGLPLG